MDVKNFRDVYPEPPMATFPDTIETGLEKLNTILGRADGLIIRKDGVIELSINGEVFALVDLASDDDIRAMHPDPDNAVAEGE